MLDVVSGGGDRGDASQSPVKDASSLDSSSESGSSKALNFDLLNMVVSYKRMAIFLEPVTDALEVLRYLLGWRLPLCSLLCCILLNILFITLSQVAWFSVLLLVVSVPAVLGYVGERCHGDASETALQKKKHYAVQRRELQTVNISRQEAMLEVKSLLKQLDDLLTQACGYAESVYKVLYWESHATSSVFYGFLLMMVCLLYSAPVGWSLSLVNSALFLWNRDFCRGHGCVYRISPTHFLHIQGMQMPHICAKLNYMKPSDKKLMNNHSVSLQDLSPGSVEEAEEAEPDDEFKDAIEDDEETVSVCSSDYDSVSDNGLLSRNEPIRSKVSKLTEKLRKRVPTNPTGNCSSCAAAFSVLKKRRHCTNCGVSFCSRCCSFKVFKSSMGATAPEAQRETVFVCAMCNAALSSK
uniref:Protrudin n=1 Tax=Astyanax mexicanus TaxID=7994 RepID=A0A8B9HZJ7_ASTMX